VEGEIAMPCPDCKLVVSEDKKTIHALQSERAEMVAQLEWVGRALQGFPLNDFALSFPIVRAVADLSVERDAALEEAHAERTAHGHAQVELEAAQNRLAIFEAR
jgi:hypothetical protein